MQAPSETTTGYLVYPISIAILSQMVHPPVTQPNEQNSGLVANFEAGVDVVLIRRQVATVNTNMTLIEKQ
ncbi:hypothetical protein E4U24_000869 [Claviceps purpurea]|nr:hypothetical protein E4U24_000869 [Claviceps purpurea]